MLVFQGIGFEIARILGKSPGTLCILGCRNVDLGANAEKLLKSDGCNVASRRLDLSDSESITAFAVQVFDFLCVFYSFKYVNIESLLFIVLE